MSSACSSDLENQSVSELVSILRAAYRTADFDQVEEVLVAREEKMKKDFENKNKEFESLQNKYAYLRLDNLILEDTLQRFNIDPKEFEKWRETSEKLKMKEKTTSERYEKLLKEVKRTQKDDQKIINELNRKNSELECAKRAVELDVELWKKKYEELRHRLSQKGKQKYSDGNARPPIRFTYARRKQKVLDEGAGNSHVNE